MSFKPAGWHSLTPRIFTADPAGLVAFLREAFDASGEVHSSRPAEIQIGDSWLMVSSDREREAAAAVLYLYVPDADGTYARALSAGATSLEAPTDTHYGDRRAMVRDAWGNTWQIATRMPSAD